MTFLFAPILVFIICIFYESYRVKGIISSYITLIISLSITFTVIAVDYSIRTTDIEVWSGEVVDWYHKEEWDEWHPEECTTSTDSEGVSTTYCIPGYWEHHYAENKIKTSDNGWFYVYESPDGKKFNDSWPNDDSVLKQYWPEGTPSASLHTYKNKVQASYSIYKHKEINLNDYEGLPDYPLQVKNYINIDRIIGYVPNKEEALKTLAQANTNLNVFIPDPENPGKTKSWKQVNLIFVNVGENKTRDWGYALPDYWEGGNKNDFVVSFSMNSEGYVSWVYAFSWSEVEILKLEVQDYITNLGKIEDFVPIVKKVEQLVGEKFERKQFVDFEYLSINPSDTAMWIVWILNIIVLIVFIGYIENEKTFP